MTDAARAPIEKALTELREHADYGDDEIQHIDELMNDVWNAAATALADENSRLAAELESFKGAGADGAIAGPMIWWKRQAYLARAESARLAARVAALTAAAERARTARLGVVKRLREMADENPEGYLHWNGFLCEAADKLEAEIRAAEEP